MKSTILLLSLTLLVRTALSQTHEIDSLQKLAKAARPVDQLDYYVTLAALSRNVNSDTALYFANKANELGEASGDELKKLKGYVTIGKILATRASYLLSTKYYSQALAIATKLGNDSMIAVANSGLGSADWQMGKHASALDHHFKALQIRERINDRSGIPMAKINIGMVYQTQNKLPLAEKYVGEALVNLRQLDGDPAILMSALHTQANIYGMQGKIQNALELDREGITVAERTNSEFGKSVFYDNMGNCFLYDDPPDYAKAAMYFRLTLKIDSSFDNKKQMSDSYLNLAHVFDATKTYDSAALSYQRSVLLATESGYIQGKINALDGLSKLYAAMGKPDDAFQTLQQSILVKDSMFNAASEEKIAEVQTVYETEKKEQQIKLQQEQLSKKNYLLLATMIVAFLLALLGYSFYRRTRLKQQARLQAEIMRQQEMATKAVIEAEEEERKRIARDLHDGVGQMMSAAKMNLSAFGSNIELSTIEQKHSFDKIIGLVDDSCKEIRSVSHNMMPNALLKNSLATAIREFIDKMDKKSLQVHLYTEGLDERLDSNVETVFYRVIQECVNNVIKHADATTLDISVIRDASGISATIEDNGKGFEAADRERFDGIGLKNITTRIEYLKGTVDFDSATGRGTVVALHVPL